MELNELASPLYSALQREYQEAYYGPYRDVGYDDKDCLVLASVKGDLITAWGRPVIAVGNPKLLREHAQRLLEMPQDIWCMDLLEDGCVGEFAKVLIEQNQPYRITLTQVIDLTKPVIHLHRDIRKSYKSLINRGKELLDIQVLGKDATQDVVREYRRLYESRVGTMARPAKTFDVQYKVLLAGEAILVTGRQGNRMVAVAFFDHNQTSAYYSSAKSEDGVDTHALIWEGIIALKSRGIKTLEMGEQIYGENKLANISVFKRGYGGSTMARLLIGKSA